MEGCGFSSTPTPPIYSAESCECRDGPQNASQSLERGTEPCCSRPPLISSSPSFACRYCACSSASQHGSLPPDGNDQDQLLKQVNSVFSAADASLHAFWRASIARVEMKAEIGAGSEAAYSQVRTAARSQAAASIAWVLAAAAVVLQEDAEDEEDDDQSAGAHAPYPGSANAYHHQYADFYAYHRNYPTPEYHNSQKIIRRSTAGQLSRSSAMHGTAGSRCYGGNRSAPRWEWRPIIRNRNSSSYSTSSNIGCMSSRPCTAPSPSVSPSVSPAKPAAAADNRHPYGIPSITISSLLPPLINCRIANTPYNKELPPNGNGKDSNSTLYDDLSHSIGDQRSHSGHSSEIPTKITEDLTPTSPQFENHNISIAIVDTHEVTKTLVEPFHGTDELETIDIIDTHEVTKTLVEPFHGDHEFETLQETLNTDKKVDEEENKEKLIFDLSQHSRTHAWRDNVDTFDGLASPHHSSLDVINMCSNPASQQDIELGALTTMHGGKNHKKHLKKKQRKTSTSQL